MRIDNVVLKIGGVTITGSAAEVAKTAAALGHRNVVIPGYYYSDSTGDYVEISEMHVAHIRNAIVKKMDLGVASLDTLSGVELIEAMDIFLGDAELEQLVRAYRAKV